MKPTEFGYYESHNGWFVVRGSTNLLEPKQNDYDFVYKLDDEVEKWLKENCRSWDGRNPTICIGIYIELWFREKHDALHFSMKWL